MKLCECGCGQPTKLATQTNTKRGWIKGQPLRFIHNHHGRKQRPNCICQNCGKEYQVKSEKELTRTKYCSHRCLVIANNKARGRDYGELKLGKDGRLKIKLPEHPYCDRKGYVFFYRYVLEQHLGHHLDPKKYVVHHIDKDHTNDVLSNLVAMTPSAHSYIHILNKSRAKGGELCSSMGC